MQRQIFIVYAHVVDSTGKLSILEGYSKAYDGQYYDNDMDKAED